MDSGAAFPTNKLPKRNPASPLHPLSSSGPGCSLVISVGDDLNKSKKASQDAYTHIRGVPDHSSPVACEAVLTH